ncbi:succinyl-diaminopimelate desuccinylase, partial [Buchnera aphidicola (Hormaphis cornu)]
QDLGCQEVICNRLSSLGFTIRRINIQDTSNIWATYGNCGKTINFLGHTDVVPVGELKDWRFHPFQPTIHEGVLFGRGAADMKGAIAAMIIAIERFVLCYPDHVYRLTLILTSDEESKAINGTVKVVDYLLSKKETIDYCIVGEPTSIQQIGDTIKNGRRGSLTANIIIYGVQGHIAYPELANNPIHTVLPFLSALISKEWSKKDSFFSKTSVQLSQIRSDLQCSNMIPGSVFIQFNFRYGMNITAELIKLEVNKLLNFYKLKYSIEWNFSGHPFLNKKSKLVSIVKDVIYFVNNVNSNLSTDGGTSDGRFLAKMSAQIVELGLINKNIHKVNECIKVSDLQLLSQMYFEIIRRLVLFS